MDIARLQFDENALVAVQVLKLQLELNDGHSVRATRSIEELVLLLEMSLESESEDVRKALVQLIGRMTTRHVVCFETLGVNFQPIKQWATERHIVLSSQPD
tara:strand:+ start:181 stop:483 length:303 start_codon:yes stop_codon:yes gene_type:complete